MVSYPLTFGMSDRALAEAECAVADAPHEQPRTVACPDCLGPIVLEPTEDGWVALGCVYDGPDAVHAACYRARCDECGSRVGDVCEHRPEAPH